jgi:uncharacterized membrane protein YqjE
MVRSKVATLISLSIGLLSLGLGIGVGVAFEHFALGLVVGLLTCLGLVSLYALLAWIFGWPKLRWNDVFAVGYLLP